MFHLNKNFLKRSSSEAELQNRAVHYILHSVSGWGQCIHIHTLTIHDYHQHMIIDQFEVICKLFLFA